MGILSTETILERRHRLLGTGPRLYYDVPFHPVRGSGVFLYDVDGKEYIDVYNNVPHVGHCHPYVVEAINRQIATLNTNTRYLFTSVLDYAERLVKTTSPGLDTVLFTCTGSEANDLAWRLAHIFTRRRGVITTNRAYHGNTAFLRAIDASSPPADGNIPEWCDVVGPATPCEYTDDASRALAAEDYRLEFAKSVQKLTDKQFAPAAFFFDTFFCSEGVHAPMEGFLASTMALARKNGVLVVADEVQAGLSRGGKAVWGFQQHGIVPDIVTCGKPMGNGHPIGVVITRRDIADAFFKADRYFNTFAGNPVSCVAGLAVLDVLANENLQENARSTGQVLIDGLRSLALRHEVIGAVRGDGFLIGVELVDDRSTRAPAGKRARRIINELCARGVLVGLTGPNRAARNIMKIRPPMVFDANHADRVLSEIENVLFLTEGGCGLR